MSTTNKFNSECLDFSLCTPPCKEEDISPELLSLLRSAQKLVGFRFTLTSGYRSKAYELSKGRRGSSAHCKTPGLAVDISTVDSHTRFKVLAALLAVGVPRIGIGRNFIHADIDESKAHPIIFHYYE